MRRKSITHMAAALAAAVMMLGSIGATAALADDKTPNTFDSTTTGSLTIYKYDLDAAQSAGVTGYPKDGTGEVDSDTQTALTKYGLQGVEFTYVKVGEISMDTDAAADGTSATVKMMYTISDALEKTLVDAKALTTTSDKYTSDQLNTALATAVSTAAGKNALEEYAASVADKKTMTTSSSGQASASSLDLGLYLVVETKVPKDVNSTTNPFFVSIPMTDTTGDKWLYNVTVYPKNQTDVPTVDKLVKQHDETNYNENCTTASIGDTVNYNIVSKMPTITTESTYLTKYTFVDTASKGIAYKVESDKTVPTVSIKFYSTEAEAKKGTGTTVLTLTQVTDSTGDYTVAYDSTKRTMTVTFTEAGLAKINPAMSAKYMSITYDATITSDAVLGDSGNANDIALTYRRTSSSSDSTTDSNPPYEETIKDKTKVYTYGIGLQKNFSGTVTDASGVTFTVERATTVSGTTTYSSISSLKDASNVYTVCDASTSGAVTEYNPTAAGKLDIRGLAAGTYRITETKTVSGYVLLKDPITVVITASSITITPSAATRTGIANDDHSKVIEGTTTAATAKVNDKDASMSADNGSANAVVDFTVTNNKGFTLPQTGGWGTILFTMIGAAGLVVGTLMLRKKKRT